MPSEDDPPYAIPDTSRGLKRIKRELDIRCRESPIVSSKVCPLLEELGRELMSPDMAREVLDSSKELITILNLVLQDSSSDKQSLLAVTTLSIFLNLVVTRTSKSGKATDGPWEYVHLAAAMLYHPLIRLLEEGDRESQKRTAWCLHFLAAIAPDCGLQWNRGQRQAAAEGLSRLLLSQESELKIAACHALSMSMQKDTQFRIHFAEAGGVPPLLRMLQDPRSLAITAAAGALHALTYKQLGWVKWVCELGGIPILTHVLERMPPGPREHRFALTQVLWIFGNMAACDEDVTNEIVNAGLLSCLCSILVGHAGPESANQDSVVSGAAASCLEAVLLGDVQSMGPMSAEELASTKLRKMVAQRVVKIFGHDTIEEFGSSPIATLCQISSVLSQVSQDVQQREKQAAGDKKLMASAVRITETAADRKSGSHLEAVRRSKAQEDQGKLEVERSSTGKKTGMRTALVVGVSNYDSLSKVKYATANSEALAEKLTKAEFTVTTLLDPDSVTLRSSMLQFESRAMAGSMVLIYFCGHGTCSAIDGHHYLLPSNFQPPPEGAEETLNHDGAGNVLQSQCGDLDILLLKLRSKSVSKTIIITDCCNRSSAAAASNAMLQSSDNLFASVGSDFTIPNHSPGSSLTAPLSLLFPKPPPIGVPGEPSAAELASENIGPTPERSSPSSKPPGSTRRTSTTGMPTRTSRTSPGGMLNATDRKKRESGSGAAPKGPKTRATSALTPWTDEGLEAAVVLGASSSGTETIGPEKGSKISLFMENVLRYFFIRNLLFRKALNMVISTVRDHSKGVQVPFLRDTNVLPADFKLSEE